MPLTSCWELGHFLVFFLFFWNTENMFALSVSVESKWSDFRNSKWVLWNWVSTVECVELFVFFSFICTTVLLCVQQTLCDLKDDCKWKRENFWRMEFRDYFGCAYKFDLVILWHYLWVDFSFTEFIDLRQIITNNNN